MVDLETFGKAPLGAIVQIGAVKIDPEFGVLPGNRLSIDINLESAISRGMTMDASTISWWMGTELEEARKALKLNDGDGLLYAMRQWQVYSNGANRVWSHSTFDAVILRAAAGLCQIKLGYGHKEERDFRTICGLIDGEEVHELYKKHGTSRLKHNALSDAICQAGVLVDICRKLNLPFG